MQRAAREFAQTELAGHRYVPVLHDHQANPHVHLSVRAEGRDGKRLNPRNADLQRWRETFAEKLRAWGYQAPIGIALIVLGVGIGAISIRSFLIAGTTPNPTRPKNATQLVTSGAYSLSRNPMYVGDMVMLAGIAVWIGSVLNLTLIAAFVWYIDRFQIAAEERALAEVFGDRYVTYRGKVRSWL